MKTVVITGAGGNLGKAAVAVFASAGWRVIGVVTPGKLPKGSQENIVYKEADLQQEESSKLLIQQWIAQYGTIDAALLLVGGFEAGSIDKADGAAIKRMYSLNFETAYNLARPLMSHIQQHENGKIVFVGAKPALDARAGKGLVAYGLSKSLLFKLAEYMNAAAGRVLAHVVVFQALDTPENRASMPEADTANWVKPEQVAYRMLQIIDGKDERVVEIAGG